MKTRHTAAAAALLALLALPACEDNPMAPGSMVVELTMSTDHVHTLSEITFTVSVTQDGVPVTDFEMIEVQRLAAGSDTWRGTELTLSGDVYTGTYTFASSGEYQLRVAALHHGATEMEVLIEEHDPLHVGRAHEVVGDYRVEFESDPGHLHEGDVATLQFWVLTAEADADGERHPVEGLHHLIAHCVDDEHEPVEVEPGLYTAPHEFVEAGEFHVGLHIMNHDGGMVGEASFTGHVAHAH